MVMPNYGQVDATRPLSRILNTCLCRLHEIVENTLESKSHTLTLCDQTKNFAFAFAKESHQTTDHPCPCDYILHARAAGPRSFDVALQGNWIRPSCLARSTEQSQRGLLSGDLSSFGYVQISYSLSPHVYAVSFSQGFLDLGLRCLLR